MSVKVLLGKTTWIRRLRKANGSTPQPPPPPSVAGHLLIHWWLDYNKNVEKNLLTSLSLCVSIYLCWFLSLSLCVSLCLYLPDWAGTSIFCLQTGVHILVLLVQVFRPGPEITPSVLLLLRPLDLALEQYYQFSQVLSLYTNYWDLSASVRTLVQYYGKIMYCVFSCGKSFTGLM